MSPETEIDLPPLRRVSDEATKKQHSKVNKWRITFIIGFSKHLKGKIDALCGLLKLTIKYILMSHKTKMQSWQGDIYYKPKTRSKIEFYGWWFLGYNFFYWWWGSFTIFFGGWWGWKIYASPPPPPPHTHLILEQPLYNMRFEW